MFSLFLAPLLIAAAAQAEAPAPTPASEAMLRDTRGRPVIRVRLNDSGPYPMIVDTAAQTSLITAALAAELGIAPLDGAIGVKGATGSSQSVLYPVDRYATALFDEREVAMVGLPNVGATDARGIVGMEVLGTRRLTFDYKGAQVRVDASGPAPAGFVTHRGTLNDSGFLEVPVRLETATVPALVDTGAAVTIANGAALRLLGWAEDDPRLKDGGEIRGAGGAGSRVRIATLREVSIGPVRLRDVPIVFRDDDGSAPRLILGSDLLGRLDAFAVDFGRGELQIALPRRP